MFNWSRDLHAHWYLFSQHIIVRGPISDWSTQRRFSTIPKNVPDCQTKYMSSGVRAAAAAAAMAAALFNQISNLIS